MRENVNNQDLACALPCLFTIRPKSSHAPMVDTHVLVQGFGRKPEKEQVRRRTLSLRSSCPDSKANSPNKQKLEIDISEIHVNVKPVTNPTPMTKADG